MCLPFYKINPMKFIVFAFIMIQISLAIARGGEAQQVPDLSKAFPNEKFIGKIIVNENEYYNFNTDSEYEHLKATLITFLGKEWTESPIQEPKTELQRIIQKNYEGFATFNNEQLNGISIVFTVKKSRASSGEKFIASLHIKKEE